MNISVNEKTQQFYLALNEWEPVTGHGITVGDYRFCAIPAGKVINVSEVTSGCKVVTFPMTIGVTLSTATKEDALQFFHKIGEYLKRIIKSHKNFGNEVERMRKVAFEKLGAMPPITDNDIDWIFEDESDDLN